MSNIISTLGEEVEVLKEYKYLCSPGLEMHEMLFIRRGRADYMSSTSIRLPAFEAGGYVPSMSLLGLRLTWMLNSQYSRDLDLDLQCSFIHHCPNSSPFIPLCA